MTGRNDSLPPQLREALDIMGRRGKVVELTAPAARTPCSDPNPCEGGEPCDRHETEQAHAEGEHTFCGPTCEVEYPSEQLRNFILAKGYPGTAGMLDELLRRAAAGRGADAHAHRAAVLREAADRYQGFIDNADTGADPRYWTGIHHMTSGLRHMADEKPEAQS